MLSDDDAVATHFLGRCRNVLGHGVPLVVTLGDVLDAQTGRRRHARTSKALASGVHEGTAILREFLLDAISPQMCTVAVNTEMLRSRGGFPDGWPHTGDLVSWVPLLLQGNAGFVNESCGTYRSHAEAQTAQMPLESRLNDIDRLANVIAAETERHVSDPLVSTELRNLVGRYATRNLVGHMADARRSGASRRNIASAAWAWRRRILQRGSVDLRSLARPLVLFVAPVRLMPAISRVNRRLEAIRGSKQ